MTNLSWKCSLAGVAAFAFFVVAIDAQERVKNTEHLAAAQKKVDRVCNSAFDVVAGAMRPSHIYRRLLFTSDCDFEFISSEGVQLLMSIEIYEDRSKSRIGFKEAVQPGWQNDNLSPASHIKLDRRYWDDVKIRLSKREYDTYFALRKDTCVVLFFSDNQPTLLKLERLVREANIFTESFDRHK